MNDRYKVILKGSGFKNDDRWEGPKPLQKGKPNWSGNRCVVEQEIKPGTYRIAAWQYEDGNVSFQISEDTQRFETTGVENDFK
jgi:hypothetical protein|tara:strand:+ start:423 stop:671 length:249 start_codon:yes stop_codon:yes gene_type:complete